MDVISTFIDDVDKGTVDGITCIRPDGQRVRVFLDMVGFLTDFYEAEMNSRRHTPYLC